jgi:uncharacterized protein YprB with RNaseH-like and TPR domain
VDGGLSARLKRIQESQKSRKKAVIGESSASDGARDRKPHGQWKRLKPFVLYRETSYPLEFPQAFDGRPFLLKRISPASKRGEVAGRPCEGEISAIERDRLFFIDIETTGLSTGAGTIAFAFGSGSFAAESFLVRQIFLEDYPGEPDFVELLLGMIPEDAVLVSYNGAAFDLGVLRTRCILLGKRFPEKGHIDLLRTARRLWSRPHGGASLSLMEERVLARPRIDDLPGSQAPDRYFEFLKGGDFSRVEPVLDHHRQDILALPLLLSKAASIFSFPEEAQGVDGARLGLCLSALGRGEWESVLRKAYESGQEEAGRVLAQLYKRRGRWPQAISLWSGMAPSYKILRDLEIAYERRLGDFDKAIKICHAALAFDLSEEEKTDFSYRLERLNRVRTKKR